MYKIKFSKNSNPAVYDCFLRAIDNLKPIIGGNISELKRGLEERYGAKLLSHTFNGKSNETEYVFEFVSEREYFLFLIHV